MARGSLFFPLIPSQFGPSPVRSNCRVSRGRHDVSRPWVSTRTKLSSSMMQEDANMNPHVRHMDGASERDEKKKKWNEAWQLQCPTGFGFHVNLDRNRNYWTRQDALALTASPVFSTTAAADPATSDEYLPSYLTYQVFMLQAVQLLAFQVLIMTSANQELRLLRPRGSGLGDGKLEISQVGTIRYGVGVHRSPDRLPLKRSCVQGSQSSSYCYKSPCGNGLR
ncbi:hypothetical protein B0I37DRAFT_208641 [Chaetomium sp. MPI-CAGE-AT-0009]|nr:hypothetical protein B0I37DRAFT_208641 [Chaetomium sp. MPI-CAGE-AT-0009]